MSYFDKKLIRITTVPISMNIILRGQLKFINNYFHVIGISSLDHKHFKECQIREDIEMHAINMAREISLLMDFKALIKLYIFFRKEKPLIVHSNTPKAGLLGMLAAYIARVPVRLHTVGGMPLTEAKGLKKSILVYAEKLTYSCAHTVYPNSFGLMDIIIRNKLCASKKLKVIANGGTNGINTRYFTPDYLGDRDLAKNKLRKEYGIGNEDIVYCFVGRLAKEKGIGELVQAFQELRNELGERKIKLLLVGPFENTYGVLEESIKKIIINDPDVIAPGRFDDVRPFYLLSDIFVFPSYREGFPNTVLEAGAMALPAIVTDINGCNEIVQDKSSGFLVPPKDIQKLKDAMKSLYFDKDLRNIYGANACRLIIEKFRNEIIWEATLAEYNAHLKHVHLN